MWALVFALILFYFMHSFLASMKVKQWMAMHWKLVRWYRLFYSFISTVLLAVIIWILVSSPFTEMISIPFPVRMAGLLMLLGGIALSLGAVMRFGAMGFLGFRPEPSVGLVRTGIHGRVRHPIYTGIILAALGWAVLSPTLPVILTIVITFIYLPIGIHLEERKLIGQFGEEYIRYRNEVSALFPHFKMRANEQAQKPNPPPRE